jgi:hypothetical protein
MLKHWKILSIVTALAMATCVGYSTHQAHGGKGGKQVEPRVFEMRTYYAHKGKMEALHARFRDHTNKLFVKHGMTLVGYWSPIDSKQAEEKMVYILAYPSKEAADKSWKDFRDDPAWKAAREASEKDGPLVAKVESVFLKATDYSPIK